jgi:hypothetical protein
VRDWKDDHLDQFIRVGNCGLVDLKDVVTVTLDKLPSVNTITAVKGPQRAICVVRGRRGCCSTTITRATVVTVGYGQSPFRADWNSLPRS